jgi:hypothetical protein
VIDFKSVAETRRDLTKVYHIVLCEMRRDEVKIFAFLLFFLELFTKLNSGHANKANVSEGPLFVLVLKFPFYLNITSYIRINKSRANF